MLFLQASIRQPFRFLSAGQFITESPWIHPTRTLDSFEIIVGVEGALRIYQDDVNYVVEPGQAVLLFPHHTHGGTHVNNSRVSFYWCHFLCTDAFDVFHRTDEEQASHVGEVHATDIDDKSSDSLILPASYDPTNVERLHVVFNQLLHVANAHVYTSQAVNYWLTCVLIELSEQYVAGKLAEQQANRRFESMLEWIRINADLPLTVRSLANRFSYNRDYLSRLFKRELGMGPQAYIHTIKVSKAKELLLKTNKSVKEVADALGFQDEKHFMKLFKTCENLTPSEYRRAYYKSHYNKI